jgi:CDP-diglyceride synthetase
LQKPPTTEEKQAAYEKKKADFTTRTFWTFVMFGLFFTALFMGHVYIIAIITAIQIVSFKEVIAIANVPSRARSLRSTKSLNWYWLATTMYFLYGESVIYYFKHIVLVDKVLLPLATHHRFISFILYVFGLFSLSCAGMDRDDGLLTCAQASSLLSLPSRLVTTSSSLPTLRGRTWLCTSSLCRLTSS